MGIDNVETARMAARESVGAFEDPKCAAELARIRGECGTDIAKFFMMAIPKATEILSSVIVKYGYSPDQQGSLTFTEDLKNFEFDPEIKGLSERVKSQFVPSAQS
ncbi:hypothetical protein GUITHDRAFT_151555 [Guillardia theta CCMP2712]|uniref:Protein C10 n=1 Tax=Guillardia theta (strain CCMP2712) TaxID=905079 RepID=L1JLP0_GUITC|nr:hypothetical protein GUITHDRAFT_151555 [Guillardia theta CCMP2712]EKX49466.1 hypothetical protein GUITHDRAFT_151555 [Guillardia theta CCMP2712]|mmetsp:Transcript_29881/g.95713  ORF Transcript_29881/g.95713 Transcript_29881/m.95713 type:complete len:105 (-) Transcript_29881:2443-2757(-)|eukprot:XP_005836446.1 hypothetical protein GUITHDRAFT_151555 [Guillardia theta CCMP2712]